MRIPEKVERNEAVIAMRERGETYRAIANQFGISIPGARQICVRAEKRKRLEHDELAVALRSAAESLGKSEWHSTRVYECLRRNWVKNLAKLRETPDSELMNMSGFGVGSLEIVRKARGLGDDNAGR